MLKLNTKKRVRLSRLTLPLIALALVVGACTTQEEMRKETHKELSGQDAYSQFCASCHGVTGKGDGPLAVHLEPAPNDLTLIAKFSGGVYPYNDVYETIDGRAEIRGHGTGQMPVWGERFAEDGPYAHATIQNLVLFLEKMQVK